MFKKITLNNGLRIITVPQNNTQTATVLVISATGSKYEKKEISGISHILEHMLFKGTKKRPDKIAISEPLDRVGGSYNAFTGEEYTGYYAKVDSSHLDLALSIISDMYLNSKIDAKELQREKMVIIEEMKMYYDHPASYVQNLWNKVLYGNQPAGWDIAGTEKSVLGISRKQIIDYMKSQYSASNTVISVAGDINNISKTVDKIRRYFSAIRKEKSIEKPPVIDAPLKFPVKPGNNNSPIRQKEPNLILKHKKTDQTHFCLGVRAYNLFHPRRYSQDILALILGGMMSSRLFIKVREELGLAYYVKTSISSDIDTGSLVTQVGVDNEKAEKAILAILKEYKNISQKKVPSEELRKAKDHFKGKLSLTLETSDAKASFYGEQEVLERNILTPEKICGEIDKVTTNDILKTAQDIFRPEKLNLALIGPFTDKSKFKKLLKF